MNCHDVRERISPHVEGLLHPEERATVGEHLLACSSCRLLRDDVAALISDMKDLADDIPIPEGLTERLIAEVPAPPARIGGRTAETVALRRAAAWAIVFFGACFQLFGSQAAAFAADEFAPAASSLYAEVKERGIHARRGAREIYNNYSEASTQLLAPFRLDVPEEKDVIESSPLPPLAPKPPAPTPETEVLP